MKIGRETFRQRTNCMIRFTKKENTRRFELLNQKYGSTPLTSIEMAEFRYLQAKMEYALSIKEADQNEARLDLVIGLLEKRLENEPEEGAE